VNPFSPDVLDDPEALQLADRGGLLRALASAGALVRRAQETAGEFGVEALRGDVPPRAVLVASDAGAPYLSTLLAVLAGSNAPIVDWRQPVLPRWAGPADALIAVSTDGRHPRIAELVEQADRRGLAMAVAAPDASPVAVAAGRHPLADLTHLSGLGNRAVWWGLATPALQAIDALGLKDVGPLFSEIATALDEVAGANRPDSSALTGPAKLLATDLAEAVGVIAGAGAAATVAAQRVAAAVQLIGGSTAMAASLPDDVARVGALLEFAAADTDFFADRVSETAALPRLVLIGDDEPFDPDPGRWQSLGGDAARRAGAALSELAAARGVGSSRIDVPQAPALVRFAAATAVGDFAAAYLALGRGIDPSAPRLGELPH
jgi:glucose/mannose-6-phosphate isomerase